MLFCYFWLLASLWLQCASGGEVRFIIAGVYYSCNEILNNLIPDWKVCLARASGRFDIWLQKIARRSSGHTCDANWLWRNEAKSRPAWKLTHWSQHKTHCPTVPLWQDLTNIWPHRGLWIWPMAKPRTRNTVTRYLSMQNANFPLWSRSRWIGLL